MTSTALLAIHLTASLFGQTQIQQPWGTELLKSMHAQSAIAKVAPPQERSPDLSRYRARSSQESGSSAKGSNELNRFGGPVDPEAVRRLEERSRQYHAATQRATELMDYGRLDELLPLLQAEVRIFPDEPFTDKLADVYLLTGRHEDAYRLLAPMISRLRFVTDRSWTRLSLAAAESGEVYPGQRDYVLKIVSVWAGGIINDPAQYLSAGDSPQEVRLLSLLAVVITLTAGDESPGGFAYAERALAFDRYNPVAVLIGMVCQNNASSSPVVAEIMEDEIRGAMPRITDEQTKTGFSFYLSEIKQHLKTAKVDKDGPPLWQLGRP